MLRLRGTFAVAKGSAKVLPAGNLFIMLLCPQISSCVSNMVPESNKPISSEVSPLSNIKLPFLNSFALGLSSSIKYNISSSSSPENNRFF